MKARQRTLELFWGADVEFTVSGAMLEDAVRENASDSWM